MNYFRSLYSSRFTLRQLESKKVLWDYLASKVLNKYIEPDSTVLDLGAGYCELINAIDAQTRIAVDANPALSGYAGTGVLPVVGTIDTVPAKYLGKIDVLIMSNFLEHLPDKYVLLEVFGKCHKMLKPGGRLIIIQPNISLVKESYWDHIDHHIALNSLSLQEAVEVTGFRLSLFVERFLPLTVQSRLPVRPFLISLYLNLPQILRPFAGQSLLIAEKGRVGRK